MSTSPKDDLEAVRAIIDAVKDFKLEDQQRIFRWTLEKLGINVSTGMPPVLQSPAASPMAAHQHSAHTVTSSHPVPVPHSPPASSGAVDIKTFMALKKPRNDVQYAAAVAYYYQFEAPLAEKKESINKDDLYEATRKSGRERFANPLQTLNNAHTLGLLDRGGEKGTFVINSVGENLVAMTLPDGTPTKRPAKRAAKKTAKKKMAKPVKRAVKA